MLYSNRIVYSTSQGGSLWKDVQASIHALQAAGFRVLYNDSNTTTDGVLERRYIIQHVSAHALVVACLDTVNIFTVEE